MSEQPASPPEWVDREAFRVAFRRWLADNLPDEWRYRSFGPGDESLLQVRRAFGQSVGQAGWLTVAWPVEYGGLGLSTGHRVVVIEELARAGAPEPMNLNVLGIFAPTLLKYGTVEQCQRLLPAMASHEMLWCQGFSEPEAGSDLAAVSTRGDIEGDEIIINGQKVWTSYAHNAQYCYALMRTERGSTRHRGLSLVAVPMDQPGVTVRPLRNLVGTDEFCEVFFDGAIAPTANLVGDPGGGWALAMYALAQERSVGLAQRSLKLGAEFEALAVMIERQGRSGNPLVTSELFSSDIVDRYVHGKVVESTVRRAIAEDGAGGDIARLAPVAKLSWSEGHQRQLDLALHVLGARCAVAEDEGEEWWKAALWARAETIYGGTSEIQRNVLARHLGLPRAT